MLLQKRQLEVVPAGEGDRLLEEVERDVAACVGHVVHNVHAGDKAAEIAHLAERWRKSCAAPMMRAHGKRGWAQRQVLAHPPSKQQTFFYTHAHTYDEPDNTSHENKKAEHSPRVVSKQVSK